MDTDVVGVVAPGPSRPPHPMTSARRRGLTRMSPSLTIEGPDVTPSTDHRTATSAHPDATGILRVLVGATFVVILNETIMVNAIPRLMHDFDITARAAQWLSTAFMLTLAVVIPMTGWLLQRVTTRRAFTVALGLFITGTSSRPRRGASPYCSRPGSSRPAAPP